jgi:GT2 family glycosyltransferase
MRFQPIKVLEVELSQGVPTVEGLHAYAALKALVRLHGEPLGWVELPLCQGTCRAAALSKAILDQHSWAIVRHLVRDGLTQPLPPHGLRLDTLLTLPHPTYQGPTPTVTVAVCTRERVADLARCLDALSQLRYPALELLVVDNAPRSDATRRLVTTRYPQVRYVCEPRPGLNWARNRAIAEAQGEILAYTDDDVVVDAGWVAALAEVFATHPEVMAVTGLVVPYELETQAQLLFERYGGFGRGFERRWYRIDPEDQHRIVRYYGWSGLFGTGANMAFRRSLFQQIGTFDPALDVGTATNGGGDLEMFFRVIKEGYTLVYEPAALVRHRHRRDYASLRTQLANNGVGFSAYMVGSALAYPDERIAFMRMWLRWLFQWHLRRVVRSIRGTDPFPRDMILAELWGYFVGLGRYQRARREAERIALFDYSHAQGRHIAHAPLHHNQENSGGTLLMQPIEGEP